MTILINRQARGDVVARGLVAVLALFAFVVAAGTADAHRLAEIETSVVHTVDPSGRPVTHITHRLHAHDAIKVLGVLEGMTTPNLDSLDHMVRLSNIISQSMTLADGQVAQTLGAELDQNSVYVFQEIAGYASVHGATGLSMIEPEWVHRVNVTARDKTITSYTFSKAKGQTVEEVLAAP